MQKLFYPLVFLFAVALFSCRHSWKSEKEEAAYWDAAVIQPAHEVLYKEKQLPHALAVFDSLLQRTQQTSPFVQAGRYTLMANYYYFFTTQNAMTASCIDSGLSVLHTPKLQAQYPRTYVGFLLFGGTIAYRLSQYAKANNYYFLAKKSADLYLDPCERSGFTYNMAMVSYRQQNYGQSAAYFKEAYADQATCPVQTTAIILQQQEIQSNIGLCLMKLRQYDSALSHFNKALAITNQYKDSLGPISVDKIRGVVYGNIAQIQVSQGRLPEAEELFKKSIALNARPGYEQSDAIFAQEHLAEVYGIQKRYTEMAGLLRQVRRDLDSLPDTITEAEWRRLMYAYYRETKQPLSELRYFHSYVALRDSIAEQQKALVQADITRQLKDKEQELQITVLKKDNQLALIYLGVAIALSIMAAVIIFLIYQNYRRSKKNIKELTALHEKVSRQKAALEKANREKDRILHVVAHDLRSPIGITAYVADLIMMEERNEKDRASLKMIKEASEQALSLANELLGLRVPGDDEAVAERTDLVPLVETAVQMLRHKASEKKQQLTVMTPGDNLFVQGYPERLNRVVSNLLINAIKFSPPQGVIRVSLEKRGTEALFSVADNGIGIPVHLQPEVFDRLTPARRKGTGGEPSFGLGLSICKEIVEEHGGRIWLVSGDGTGTIFSVALPLADNV
jgi:signal transduction histidine kinase